jgi:hypothetical protein
MSHEIRLNGGEIGILKTLGFSGTQMYGKILLERAEEMLPAEFIDTLDGLISLGYVLSTKANVRTIEEANNAFFRVNPSYSRDLKEAVNPGGRRDKEERGRRKRRS